MTHNVIELLEDPVFLRCVLDDDSGDGKVRYSSNIHPTSHEIEEAERILLTLDDGECAISQQEIKMLKKRIKSLIEAEIGRKNN